MVAICSAIHGYLPRTDGVCLSDNPLCCYRRSIKFWVWAPESTAVFWWISHRARRFDLGTLPGFTGHRGFWRQSARRDRRRWRIPGFIGSAPVLGATLKVRPWNCRFAGRACRSLVYAINPVGQIVGVFFALDFQRPSGLFAEESSPPISILLSSAKRFGSGRRQHQCSVGTPG